MFAARSRRGLSPFRRRRKRGQSPHVLCDASPDYLAVVTCGGFFFRIIFSAVD